MRMHTKKVFLYFVSVGILFGCSDSKRRLNQSEINQSSPVVEYEVVEDKAQLAAIYELPHMKEWYQKRVLPPKFDFEIDLNNKSYIELLLLQNEVYARNGYLFMDAALRGHFNQFKWYQPVFDVPDFKVQLSRQESDFINKVLRLKKEKFRNQFIDAGGYKLINPEFVFNRIQFDTVRPELMQKFNKLNFAIVPAAREQLFYVYDENQYQYIPNFYTTDLYLQLMHKYMSSLLQSVEETKMIKLVSGLIEKLNSKASKALSVEGDPEVLKAVAWANTYLSIALTNLTAEEVTVNPTMKQYYSEELVKIQHASGMGSAFLGDRFIDYSQFKPVGNYVKNDTLARYFRCIKWLNTAAFGDSDLHFMAASLTALWINDDIELKSEFERLNNIIGAFAGDEDGASVFLIMGILKELGITTTAGLSVENLSKIRGLVDARKVDRIKPKGSDQLRKFKVFFLAGRYTFDSEILIRLVNVADFKPKRPFPKGLDVMAALGSNEARNILINSYQEARNWPEYTDTLKAITDRFSQFKNWNSSIYNKTMECINALNAQDLSYPLFMQTPFWERKSLNTSLAAWTELKHDLTLYTEHPYAAEAGQGGGPPPPTHLSYVEPNKRFWEKAVELLNYQLTVLRKLDMINEEQLTLGQDIKEKGIFLLNICEKELARIPLTNSDFSELTWMGGTIEQLTFRTIHTDHLPEREKQIALTTDVYSYQTLVLQEAVGLADEIYVIAEINGYPYITKGAVFSYYEFTSPIRLTDEDWQRKLPTGQGFERPKWMMDIVVDTPSLKSKPSYSF